MANPSEQLVFTQSPAVVIATNTFLCRIPVRYQDTPMMEFIREMTTLNTPGITTKIPIFHNDGTQLAIVKGARLFDTKDGEKAGVKLRHLPDGQVCELNGKTLFELRRSAAAAISMTAELFTPDGAFLKWSPKELNGLLTLEPGKPLKIGGAVFSNNYFQGDVGIQIGRPTESIGACCMLDFRD